MNKNRPELLALVPIFIAFVGCTYDGLLQSPDSYYYISIAQNLINHGKLYEPHGHPIIYWPPVYSVSIIPFFYFTHYPVLWHALLLVVHQVLWVHIARLVLRSSALDFFSLLLGLNTLLLMTAIYLWSEWLFMTLMAGVVALVIHYLDEPKNRYLIGMAVLLSLALLTRNAGVFFLPGLSMFVLIWVHRKVRWKLLTALLLATLGSIAWNFHRLYLLDHMEVFGELFPSFTPWINAQNVFTELGANFLPRYLLSNSLILLIVITLVLFILTWVWYHSDSILRFLMCLFVSYFVFWLFIPAVTDNLGRFLAPVIPLFLILLQSFLSKFWVHRFHHHYIIAINVYLVLFSFLRIITNMITWSNLI